MKTQIIYDEKGYVLSIKQGEPEPRNPIGVPFLNVEIPSDKQMKIVDGIGVDVTKKPHEVMLEDIPKGEQQKINDALEDTRLALIELADVILGGM